MVGSGHRCNSLEEGAPDEELKMVPFRGEIPSVFEDIQGVSSLHGSKTVGEENCVNCLSEMSKSSRMGSFLS